MTDQIIDPFAAPKAKTKKEKPVVKSLSIVSIPHQLQEAFDSLHVDEETGEIVDNGALGDLVKMSEEKIAHCAMYMKSIEAEIVQLEEGMKACEAYIKDRQKTLDFFDAAILNAMSALGTTKIVSPATTVMIVKKAATIQVNNPDLIPAEFWVTPEPKPVEPRIDRKELLKAALKAESDSDFLPPGCEIVRGSYLKIK